MPPPQNLYEFVSALDSKHGVFVGGRWSGAATTFAVHDPATGALVAEVSDGSTEEATAAVEAATEALPAWAATPPRQRAEVLRQAFETLAGSVAELAPLISWENGKALADARAEISYAAEFFRWFSEEAVRSEGDYTVSPAGGTRTIVTHQPVGTAALVTPWNFPAAMATRKIAPALAAGCTIVLKPAAETPLTALAVARLLQRAGVPDGVVNVVPTADPEAVVSTWLAHPSVRKLSFTGSTGVGRHLLRQAADRVLNSSMELGGNAPFIVTRDADLDAAVAGAMVAKFRNGGQACTAANRFYIHADVAEQFVRRLGEAIATLRVGPALDGDNEIGPLISQKALTSVRGLVEDAVSAGARVSHQAAAPGEGFFFPPTLLVDVPADARVVREEIFGPVAPVVTWTDESDMLRHANASEMGLAAYVYAGRLEDALRIAEQLEAGMVGINRGTVSDPATPFGGLKQSGLGREGARDGIREFCEPRYFSVDWT